MFDTWASYESTRAFVTSSFLWQRRGSDFQTATLAAWQPSNRLHITLRHLRAATIQSSRRHERPSISTGRTTPLSLAILPTRPRRVRPTQSEHSGQRIDACERLPLLARILPKMMKTTRFLAGLPLEKVILAKRCHHPQPRQPQTHPPTKATEGSHCASSRRTSS